MNPALKSFWATKSREKILYGGRASSKTWDAAANAIRIASTVKVRFLCTRMFQNRIDESVYTVLKNQAVRFGVDKNFTFKNNSIVNDVTGSEFVFYGLARNIDEIKSLEGIDVLWIEEAHSLTKDMWGVLEPTIRKENSEIWVIFNPRFATDFVYKHFVVDKKEDRLIRKINYDENPFLSETMLSIIEDCKRSRPDEYEHIYLGVPLSSDDESIIKTDWINAAIDAHKKLGIEPMGDKVVGYDVADSGEDLNALVARHGQLALSIENWKGKEDELLKSCTRVYLEAERLEAGIIYDSIGIGASAGAKFKELNEAKGKSITYMSFNAGGKILNPELFYTENKKNKDHFFNLKAQAWYTLADRFRKTYDYVKNGNVCDVNDIISISSNCDNIETDLRTYCSSQRVYAKWADQSREQRESKKTRRSKSKYGRRFCDGLRSEKQFHTHF
ncbi:MAG: PBSX family phage terminase large subunit [Campylobacteraceae bacterium]|jgi:phage terminase large subunit|nr:PBSX family phage terminase large subunit [Campylobacteraceae bacterium]